jgi:hypothetical protein
MARDLRESTTDGVRSRRTGPGVLLHRRRVRAHRAQAARAALLGEPVQVPQPVQEPLGQPRLHAARSGADPAREAPAVHEKYTIEGARQKVEEHRGRRRETAARAGSTETVQRSSRTSRRSSTSSTTRKLMKLLSATTTGSSPGASSASSARRARSATCGSWRRTASRAPPATRSRCIIRCARCNSVSAAGRWMARPTDCVMLAIEALLMDAPGLRAERHQPRAEHGRGRALLGHRGRRDGRARPRCAEHRRLVRRTRAASGRPLLDEHVDTLARCSSTSPPAPFPADTLLNVNLPACRRPR